MGGEAWSADGIVGRGWHDRAYVPHYDGRRVVQLLTLRLVDALPIEVARRWESEWVRLPSLERNARRRARVAAWLDAGHGACWMRDPVVAALVEGALLYWAGKRYRLLAWCVMPNHVHVLVEPLDGCEIATVVRSWKSFTAHRANAWLGRDGAFWQREYHDRYVREGEHVSRVVSYVEQNPVKARLVERAEDWRFSSARWRDASGVLRLPGEGA